MFKLIIDKVLGLVGLNMVTIVLGSLLLASGYLLQKSYFTNGAQAVLLEHHTKTSQHWQTLVKERDEVILRRIKERNAAWFELSKVKKQLKDISDETGCLDSDVVPDFRLLFIPHGGNTIGSGTMPESTSNLD